MTPQRILVLGAGGHALVVIDMLLRAHAAGAPVLPIGCLDDCVRLHGQHRLGIPVLGAIAALDHIAHDGVIVAIGDNATRKTVFAAACARGEHAITARHPSAIIAADVAIGCGTVICAGVIVNPGSAIGANVILNTACTIDHGNRIGDHAHIAPGVHTGGDVSIDEGTLIGIGATVMPQCRVGKWSIVGATALVCRDLADGVVALGTPARVMHDAVVQA